MFVSPDPIASLVLVAGVFIYFAIKVAGERSGRIHAAKPGQQPVERAFVEVNVSPVSEGDSIYYVIRAEGRYRALVVNKQKHAKLSLEADSVPELRKKIEETFRAWAVTGKKRR